jgi:hypothetical protein
MGKTKQNGVLHRLRKNIMCGALSCVLMLGAVLIMPGMEMTARASNDYWNESVQYKLWDDKTASVVSCNGYTIGTEVHILATIKNNGTEYKVIGINGHVFMGSRKINKIVLEEGIQYIYEYAFSDTSITEIEIPASVNSIGKSVFGGCNIAKIRFKGTTPPTYIDPKWLEDVNNNITIEIPKGADIKTWESALKSSGYNYNFTIQTYDPTASSNTSSTTSSSPNQEKNNSNGEAEFIKEEPVNRIPEHVCQYEWEVVREVSADQDGLEQYLCKLCGNVQSTLTIPASHYQVQELYTKVTGAAEGETVTYDLGMIHTVCDKLFTKLQERKDITLVITYQYKGENYRTTFPAGADYTELMQDTDQFYGMLGLNGRCGIVTEKN